MKSKITIALMVAAVAGCLAYWLGYRQGNISAETRLFRYYQEDQGKSWRENGYHQAWICLGALTNLHEGNPAQGEAVLEEHLSEGVGRMVSSWENPRGDQFSVPQILLLDAARAYRLRHPWTNEDPERVERLEKAFKMLDTPDQVRRLESIRKVMGPAG